MTVYKVPNKDLIFHNLRTLLFSLYSVSANKWKLAAIASYPGNIK